MSEPHQAEPDEDLLEFLGGIDEGNEDSKDGDFSDFLANGGLEKTEAGKPAGTGKEGKRE